MKAAAAGSAATEGAAKEDTNKLNKFLIIYLFFIFYYKKDGSQDEVPRFNYLLKLPLYHLKILRDVIIKIASDDNDDNDDNTLNEILKTDSLKHKDCLVNMVTTIHAYYIYKKLCSNNVYHGSIDKEKLLDLTGARGEVARRTVGRTAGGTRKYKKNNQINKTRSHSSGNYNKTKDKYSSNQPNNNTRKK